MNPERWQQIDKIFQDALEREPHERASFLDQACGDDSPLREKIEALLRSHDGAGSFLASPASPLNGGEVRAPAPLQLVGQYLGSYELKAHLGSGGMGDVYRARDTQLRRDVAIKILPGEFSRDPDRVARFQREAVALAALNHPNIAAIHDLDEVNGTRFLVLEFVEGETLAARLKRGPLSVRQSLELCRQIAEGLEGAHAKGVHHRDLKPDNIQITPDDRVKLLDFGLAKTLASDSEGTDAALRNLTQWHTRPGVIMGTASYLSPEQARGQQPDKRADIWAFGCVLFEALTGRQAFTGATMMDVYAAILNSEPDWSLLPQKLPPSVQSLLRRCLQKEARQRLGDIAHARMTLEDAVADVPRPAARTKRIPSWAGGSAVAILAAGLAAFVAWNYRPSVPVTGSSGHRICRSAPVSRSRDRPIFHVAVRPANRPNAAGRDRHFPRWCERGLREQRPPSPSRDIGYPVIPHSRNCRRSQPRVLARRTVAGILDVQRSQPEEDRSQRWRTDYFDAIACCTFEPELGRRYAGVRRYQRDPCDSCLRRQPQVWVATEPPELVNNPQILEGGDAVLFSVTTSTGLDLWDNADIVLFSRKTGQRKVLLQGGSDARYISTGYRLCTRQHALRSSF